MPQLGHDFRDFISYDYLKKIKTFFDCYNVRNYLTWGFPHVLVKSNSKPMPYIDNLWLRKKERLLKNNYRSA
ncbi:hypothetical protein PARA125_001581 [Parachlamydia sp. AcF125]|nr:hypothetical protein [Parachlamydia sp. AcF125]